MSIELPVLRLGLAGFAVQQVAELDAMLRQSAPGRHVWQIGPFTEADAWWLNGARTQQVRDSFLAQGAEPSLLRRIVRVRAG